MRKTALLFAAGALLISGLFSPALAQEDAEEAPQQRVITVTTFTVPFGPEAQKFVAYMEKYVLPPAKADANTLGFRFASHLWGTTRPNYWLLTEYESLEGLEKAEAFANQWFNENFPEGSPEREEANKATQEVFLKYLSDHRDQMLSTNTNWSK